MNQDQQQAVLSCTSSRAKRKRKVVSFEQTGPQTLSIPVVTEDEIRARWYNKKEYVAIRMSVVADLNRMATEGNQNTNVEWCERGLELMTTAGLMHKKQNKMRVLAAVWNGQVKQWNEQDKIYDPEAIAIAYQQETQQCVNLARSFGIMDEQAARDEYALLFVPRQGVDAEHQEPMEESSTMQLTSVARLQAMAA
jgi:hypothetical protein